MDEITTCLISSKVFQNRQQMFRNILNLLLSIMALIAERESKSWMVYFVHIRLKQYIPRWTKSQNVARIKLGVCKEAFKSNLVSSAETLNRVLMTQSVREIVTFRKAVETLY
jgi:hypothetical protein